jgi:4-diphosphocytidyl-2-C-methyl-D-erythritol kinase
MRPAQAFAKINLGLVVGPLRDDAKHEVATVLQRVDLADEIELGPADALTIVGFDDDTLVRVALEALAHRAGVVPRWRVRIGKRIPVAAGLGGGSSDAACALALANGELPEPVTPPALHEIAASIGADVPFFLREGPQLASGDGTELRALELPTDYVVVLVVPHRQAKESTGGVYSTFDARNGAAGFDERRAALLGALTRVEHAHDLARLPRNDLASSTLADQLEGLGAFRADVTGAGPAVYGLFEHAVDAERAVAVVSRAGTAWLARPV